MTSYVTSEDGTPIAFDRFGQGPPVVVVSGMFCDRQTTQELAERLALQFSVINYDRRGRGESGDTTPYAVEREVEDLGALIAWAGGAALVYGHSSGAGLALQAAASGLPISRLVLHEPPYGSDDEESKRSARELAESVRAALAEDRRADAIELFFAASGLPPEMVEEMSRDPKRRAVAPTMPYDFEVMGDISRGGTIPEELVRAISIPTLVIAGGASPDFFRDTAARIVTILPHAKYTVLNGQDHGASADVVAPVVAEFFTIRSPEKQQPWLVRSTGLPRVPQPGEDIHAVDGATLVSSLMKVDMIDEIRAFVHPVILGGGKAWFKDVDGRRALDSPTSGGLRLDPFG